jgi:UDP-galactopyranose mutase
MKKWDVVIVGAGITGITLAERLATVANKKVLLIDKRDHIGGNCYDFVNRNGILVSKYGPHIFHTSSERVWRYLKKFSEWHKYEHRVLSYVMAKLVPVPVNIETINVLFGEDLRTKKQMQAWLDDRKVPCDFPVNSEEVAKSRVGEVLYELMFKNYTKKVWGKYPKLLEPEVLARIPVNFGYDSRYFADKYQFQPEKGFTKMFEQMLDHPNIEVRLETDFFKSIEDVGGYDHLFFSGPIDKYFRFFKKSDIRLEYRCLRFKFKTFKKEYYLPAAVVNYPNEFKFARITEYKHITGQKSRVTTISREYSGWKGVKSYPVLTKTNLNKYKELEKMINKTKKISFVGRLGSYRYINMDRAVLDALELFDKLYKK